MTALTCPKCSKPLPGNAPQGLCPECLLKAALPGQSALESAAAGLDGSEATTAVPEAGMRLKYFGDYQLLDEIARGGMGVVWKARQTSLKRDVALKMIRAGALAGPEEVQRFLREAEAAANLQHPNIVAIHEVGEHDGQHYFSMDLVEGRDLGALIKEGPLSPHAAARYVKILAEAIHFAHQRGTLHRDLKPQNVLVDAADQPRITDFGLAKFIKDDSRLTQTGVVMGSPSYMPPEQAAGRIGDIGPASDVYALGAILYELLTGKPPFSGANAVATVMAVIESEPVEPRRLKADIPLDLETICLKCLEKSPSARYPSARALAEELVRFLKGEPIQARPASSVRKVVSWARRHPGTLAALAALVMVALAFGVFYLLEENAYLRAAEGDRNLARVQAELGKELKPGEIAHLPGAYHDSLKQWTTVNSLVIVAGFYLWLGWVIAATRGMRNLSFGEQYKQAARARFTQPLGELTRTVFIAFGLTMIGCGVMVLIAAIRAHVWEAEAILTWSVFAGTYTPFYFGLVALGRVIRDYRRVHYGVPVNFSPVGNFVLSGQLTAEQTASIHAILEKDFDVEAAIKLYREALPDARWGEAYLYVNGVAQALRAEQPEKFAYPPLALANVNWKALLICALIEAVVLGVLWFSNPPAHPIAFLSVFPYSFLFGAAVVVFLRVKGLWPRLLVFLPAVLATVVSEVLLRSAGESGRPLAAYIQGWAGGIILMIAGLSGEGGRALRQKFRSNKQ